MIHNTIEVIEHLNEQYWKWPHSEWCLPIVYYMGFPMRKFEENQNVREHSILHPICLYVTSLEEKGIEQCGQKTRQFVMIVFWREAVMQMVFDAVIPTVNINIYINFLHLQWI